MTSIDVLQKYFGYNEFREGQSELINALSGNRDVLGVMPTGAGKSVCYQIPAMMFSGCTLVISPLISLMRDQVQALSAAGIPAAFINSSLSEAQFSQVISNAYSGYYKIIYIAPERLFNQSMLDLVKKLKISMIAVDEAHCISQWGQDFRPSYMDIPEFTANLQIRPVIAAFTATATNRVREDIVNNLGLNNPLTLVTGFDRPNLYFEVKRPKDKYSELLKYLKNNNDSGIVYCSTRKEVEKVCEKLISDGYSAARYHAGLSDNERNRSQDDFIFDRIKIIVATNAFGMGIDKSNVRFVIHYNMPQNVESYYQEAGRAGRDGIASDCILYYARKDIVTAAFLINQSVNRTEVTRNRQLLDQMERYCETDGCLRRYMLNYFGEETDEDCGNCSNCNNCSNCTNCNNCNEISEEIDATVDSKKILSHITRLNKAGYQFMFTRTADILLGKSEDFTDMTTFGIMKDSTRDYIKHIINRLISLGYIADNRYLAVTAKANEVLFENKTVKIRNIKPEIEPKSKFEIKKENIKKNISNQQFSFSDNLFSKLKELRFEIARDENVPAFIIFSDATLVDMCMKHPKNESEMMNVSGVGYIKFERYGEKFLKLLCENIPEEPNHKKRRK